MGGVALAAGLILAGSSLVAPATVADAQSPSPPTNAIAQWRNGQGDCGANNGNGGFANGTGAFVSATLRAHVAQKDTTMAVTFVGINGPVFDPVVGLVDDARAELHGRNEGNDEDYTLELDVNDQSDYAGTFSRLAHFVNGMSGPRCTATWDVTIALTGPLFTDVPVAAAPSTLPQTQERSTTTANQSSSAVGTKGEDSSSAPLITVVIIALVGLALAGLLVVTRVRRKQKAQCDCACTVVITGPAALPVVRASDFAWRTDQSPPMVQGASDVRLVATYKGRDVFSEGYAVDLRLECMGQGGLLSSWVEWNVVAGAHGELVLTALVDGRVACEQGGVVDVHCEGAISIDVGEPRCGPDITDQLLAVLNRILVRLRNFERMAGTPSYRAFFGVWFLADNGRNMAYFPQGIGGVTPPCPNCPECTTSITVLDRCIAGHFVGDLIFGICAGYWGVPQAIQELGGHMAELQQYGKVGLPKLEMPSFRITHEFGPVVEWGDLRIIADSPFSEAVYEVGTRAGIRAYESETYRLSRQNLQEFIHCMLPMNCSPCPDRGTNDVIGDDFSTVEWVVPGGRAVPPTWGE